MSNSTIVKTQSEDQSEGQFTQQQLFTKEDTRKPVSDTSIHPYNAIGKVVSKFNVDNQVYQGSGTGSILAPKIVLTAAHVLYQPNKHQLSKEIYFIPESQNYPDTKIKVIDFWVDPNYNHALGNSKENGLDMAFLILEQNTITNQVESLKINLEYDFQTQKSQNINITGYPGISKGQYTATGLGLQQKNDNLYHIIPTEGGNSGGPVLIQNQDGEYEIIGIHKGSTALKNYCILMKTIKNKMHLLQKTLKKYRIETEWKQYEELVLAGYKQLNSALSQKLKEKKEQRQLFTAIQQCSLLIEEIKIRRNQDEIRRKQNKISQKQDEIKKLTQKIKGLQEQIKKKQYIQHLICWEDQIKFQNHIKLHEQQLSAISKSGPLQYSKIANQYLKQSVKQKQLFSIEESNEKTRQKQKELQSLLKIFWGDTQKLQKYYNINQNLSRNGWSDIKYWKQKYGVELQQSKFYLIVWNETINMEEFNTNFNNNHLQYLHSIDCKIGDGGFEVLLNCDKFKELKILVVFNNNIKQVACKDLQKLPSLGYLDLSINPLSQNSKNQLKQFKNKHPTIKVQF